MCTAHSCQAPVLYLVLNGRQTVATLQCTTGMWQLTCLGSVFVLFLGSCSATTVTAESHRQPFHAEPGLGPYQVYDVQHGIMETNSGSSSSGSGPSFCNPAEVAQVNRIASTAP